MKDKHKIWWKIPQARYLFNRPYHCVGPTTRDDIICRINTHFTRCDSFCHCNIESFLDTLRQENSGRTLTLREQHDHIRSDPTGSHISNAIKKLRQDYITSPCHTSRLDKTCTINSDSTELGAQTLCFPEDALQHESIDNLCETPYWTEHEIRSPNTCCSRLSTALLQDLRAE